jgi:hypothetical protein
VNGYPETDYEGAKLPIRPSVGGPARGPLHELRDPGYFQDVDGKEYLLYSVAGEQGIAVAELRPVSP